MGLGVSRHASVTKVEGDVKQHDSMKSMDPIRPRVNLQSHSRRRGSELSWGGQ